MIEISNLSVSYGKNKILSGINWKIEDGSYNFLIGSNGSGKTTLIRVLLGLEKDYKGKILFDGKQINRDIVASNFGYIPQYSTIKKDFPITVEEIIRLECSLSNSHCPLDPGEHLSEIGIRKLLHKKMSDLSGGEMQKVLIAKGLVSEPKVLILDEPNNNLDKKSREFVSQLLYRWWKERGTTIIHITHDIHEVDNMGGIEIYSLINSKLERTYHEHI